MHIPIVFAINNSYIKQLEVVIASTMKHGSKKNMYEFFVLHKDIKIIKKVLQSTVQNVTTCAIL